jgi:four helix bundle protein
MANIAEGCGRNQNGQMVWFLRIAAGSATELECHFTVSEDQGFLKDPFTSELNQRVARIQRMLAGLIRRLREQ